MQISVWVPYDERRLRRLIQFIIRPQLRPCRVLGGVLIALGLVLALVDHSAPAVVLALGAGVFGLLCLVAIAPMTAARSVRMQSNLIKDGSYITIDDEWLTVAYPLVESRFRWAGLRVVETPEAWYATVSKIQAFAIPKDVLTEEQRAEFAAFLKGLQPARR